MVVKLKFHNTDIELKGVSELETVNMHDNKDWYLFHLENNGTAWYPTKYTDIVAIHKG